MIPQGKIVKRITPYIFRSISFLAIISMLGLPGFEPSFAAEQGNPNSRRVNVFYSAPGAPYPSQSIFWFGKVDSYNNYADVRMIYYNDYFKVTLHIMDRRLWYDPNHSVQDLTNWDAISLYLDMDGNTGGAPDTNAYRFDAQLYNLHSQYRGNGSGWVAASIPITVTTEWRGAGGPNSNTDDSGWVMYFSIPFSSLGLSKAPPQGTTWGIAIIMHDRDDASGSVIRHTQWPETMNPQIPETWGQMHFGMPGYSQPNALTTNNITIRQGLNGVEVPDGEVGGHTICGGTYDTWTGWGNANYAGYDQINIQNQWDIADWRCFSKYYVTFPLSSLPAGKVIISATLTMHLFGTAGGGSYGTPPDSYIQALTISEDWNENTLTWNNAPMALENISGTWVSGIIKAGSDNLYQWDVSRAVADAYTSGKPLRLALYSADGDYHTGKYFWSSDVEDWNADGRPTLNVRIGIPCNPPDIVCTFLYLPMVIR